MAAILQERSNCLLYENLCSIFTAANAKRHFSVTLCIGLSCFTLNRSEFFFSDVVAVTPTPPTSLLPAVSGENLALKKMNK